MNSAGSRFTFVDLFAGIGGFHIGLKAVGGQCLLANEWNKYAAVTYRSWTGSDRLVEGDIWSLIESGYKFPKADVLSAGFPCQPFSLAGVSKKNSLGRAHGFDDVEQGNLFFAITDVMKRIEPKVVLLENVKNLISHDRGNTWTVIQDSLNELGYGVQRSVIDAAGWVPQHRERVFIVAMKRGTFTSAEIDGFEFPKVPCDGPRMISVLEPNPDPKYMLSDALWGYLRSYAEKHRRKGNGFGFGLVGPDDISRTLSARYYKDGSEILVRQPGWRNPRRLTPNEAARLMGFDSHFAHEQGFDDRFPIDVSDSQSYKQLGNSVSPYVVRAVGEEIARVLDQRRCRSDKRIR